MMEYRTIDDAKFSITHFIETVYTKKRLHQSLGYKTPEEFEAAWMEKQKSDSIKKVNDPGIGQNELLAVP